MRCKNCGWENAPGSLTCEKCHAPLSSSVGPSVPHPAPSSAPAAPAEPAVMKGTLPEAPFVSPGGQVHLAGAAAAAAAGASVQSCPKCGYPMARGMQVCPNCGTSSVKAAGADPVQKPRPGTINPWATPQEGSFCTLKPLPWQGEGIDHAPISYSGAQIALNRSNTDPNNQSITSNVQAELSYEDGAWYLEDKSSQQTTYIHAGRRMKLQPGDIIILGNRRFEFKG